MRHFKSVGAYGAMLALFLGLAWMGTAQAQVQKSGKARLQQAVHWDGIGLRQTDKVYAVAGRMHGVLIAEKPDGFGQGMLIECARFVDIADIAKGDFPLVAQRCTARDGTGDQFLLNFDCAPKVFGDACKGTLAGGTGKFAGISGSAAFSFGAPSYVRRSCLASAKAEDCKESYATTSAMPVGTVYRIELESLIPLDLEWHIP